MHLVSCRSAALALSLVGLPLVSASVLHAQARIEDCEKIQAADAYNQCLAKFGPTSKVKSVEPVKPGDVKDSSADAAAGVVSKGGRGGGRHAARGHGRNHGRGHAVAHRHSGKSSGRKQMSFTIRKRR